MNNSSEWIKSVVTRLMSGKGRDYTYLTLFFLIFSTFIFAAIRPSLKTAFALRKEQADLEVLNTQYEAAILKVIEIQQALERMRDDIPIVDEAIPPRPNVNKLISDIQTTAQNNSVTLSGISVSEVNLRQEGSKEVKTLTINIDAQSSYPDILRFITDLSSQRRIKLADKIAITKSVQNEATASAGPLTITMHIEGFHL